jgi:predicted DNA-binding transcriptional regulator YafY
MSETIRKTARLLALLQRCNRVTVARAGHESGMSARSVYRYVASLAGVMPVRIKAGVIIMKNEKNEE